MQFAVDHHLSMPVRGTDSQKAGRASLIVIQVLMVLALVGYIFFEIALAFSNEESSTTGVAASSTQLEEPASLRVPVRLDLDTTMKSIGDDLRLGNSEGKQRQRVPCAEAAPSNAVAKAITVFVAGALLNCKWARHVIAAGAL